MNFFVIIFFLVFNHESSKILQQAAQRAKGISALGSVLQPAWIKHALSRELDQVTSGYPFQPYNL